MIISKERKKPVTLVVLEILDKRMKLSPEQKLILYTQRKGYEGEVSFDTQLQKLDKDFILLNDLLLTINGTTCQVDTMVLTAGKVFSFEIKNYAGDYYVDKENRLFTLAGKEVLNPIIQLKRTETLLRQVLAQEIPQMDIASYVIFIHPTFTLYQAPLNEPMIFPTQVASFLQSFLDNPTVTNAERTLAKKLLSMHQTDNPFYNRPDYTYECLRKGIYCDACGSYKRTYRRSFSICSSCHHKECNAQIVLKACKNYKILFPDQKLKTDAIYRWCDRQISKRTIRRIIKANYKQIGTTSATHYH